MEENDHRNYYLINSGKVWDQARIKLVTPGSAVIVDKFSIVYNKIQSIVNKLDLIQSER